MANNLSKLHELCDSFDDVELILLDYIEGKKVKKAKISTLISKHKENIKKIERILKEE